MIFVGAEDETVQIIFLRDPLGVAVAENDIGAGSAVIVAGIGIIVVLARGIACNLVVGIVNNPDVANTDDLAWCGIR